MKRVLIVVTACALAIGCGGGDNSVGPSDVQFPDSSNNVEQSDLSDNVPAEPAADPCEGDASCGKGISAQFVGLDATITSTNTGHSTHGLVCYTDEFQGPNLPATPVKWTVQARSSTTVKFPINEIAAALTWEKGQCEQKKRVQGDVFRGDACEGHIFAVAWPQDNEVTFINPDVGEWELVSEERSDTVWGDCQSTTGFDEQGIQACRPSQCGRQGEYTITRTYKNPCNEETRTSTEDKFEYEPCECPCEVEWIKEEEPVINYGEWSECIASEDNESLEITINNLFSQSTREKCYGEKTRTKTYTFYEVNSCTNERRVYDTKRKTDTKECELECPVQDKLCYYNVSGQSKYQQSICEFKLGGNPLEFGEWGNWNGNQSQHCRFTVPGIYSDPFRKFQLDPGQSDPRCNKY